MPKSKLPQIIIHNSVTLDGAFTGFEPDLGAHYGIAASYKPDIHLIGSVTARLGAEAYGGEIPSEDKTDFKKPARRGKVPYWAIIDTRGALMGLLHIYRRFEYCRDVVVIVSKSTPKRYLNYLKERKIDTIVAGNKRADLAKTMELLARKYKAKRILTDTGSQLGNLLIEQGLAREISLLVHPVIIGPGERRIFEYLVRPVRLKIKKNETMPQGLAHLVYSI